MGADKSKCLYRRGVCYRHLKDLDKAQADLDAANAKVRPSLLPRP